LPVAAEIRAALESLAGELRSTGAIVAEAALPTLNFQQDLAHAGELVGMLTGAFAPEAQAQPATLAQYLVALGQRDQAIIAWEQFFAQWDALLCPPALCTAFPHTETGAPLQVDGHEQSYWMVNAHTMPFNYSGHPAIVLPIARDRDGLPIGAQFVGKRWGEARLLAVAKAVEEIRGDKGK
jgi:amidase